MANSTIPSNPPENTSFTLGTTDDLKTLAQEIAQQAKSDIKEEVKAAADSFEKEKKSFTHRLRTYTKIQIDKLGNAVIALIAAFVMAMVMPFLVKLEMADEFGTLARSLDGLAEDSTVSNVFQRTQLLSQNALAIEEQNSDIYLAVSGLADKIDTITSEINEVNLSGVSTRLEEITLQQEQSIAQIEQSQLASFSALKAQISELGSSSGKIGPSIAKLKSQVSDQLARGQTLLNAPADERQLREWVIETHFLINFIQLESTNLIAIKSTMSQIYQQEKPFENIYDQAQQTVILLGALSKWIALFE